MPKDAPGRTGDFIGKKIVESFMRKNPDTDIHTLIGYKDAQAFLEKSRYRPD